jgi:hypothetical protein
MNSSFREWLINNYTELDNLYYDIIKYTHNTIKKNKFLDHLDKEDFFIFIYKNTRYRF